MNVYLLQVINGIGVGMLYFLLAVGLSIVFGLLRFVNFAHGAFYLLGAYFCFQAIQWGLDFWLALAIVPLLVGACGSSSDDDDGGGSGGGVDEITAGWVWYGPIEDTGWNVANEAGQLATEDELDGVTSLNADNVPYTDEATPVFEQFVTTQNANVLVDAVSYAPRPREQRFSALFTYLHADFMGIRLPSEQEWEDKFRAAGFAKVQCVPQVFPGGRLFVAFK